MKYEAVHILQKSTSLHIVIFPRKSKCNVHEWSALGLTLFTEEYDKLSIINYQIINYQFQETFYDFSRYKTNFDISSLLLITS